MTAETIDYSVPGPLTTFHPEQLPLLTALPVDPVAICAAAQSLVIHPIAAEPLGFPKERFDEQNLRPASQILSTAIELVAGRGLFDVARSPEQHVVGTCRTFATLATAFLRLRAIPARARAGFGTYFVAGKNLDHWVVEFWDRSADRWRRVDVQHLGGDFVSDPTDLAEGEFLTGGEAWQLVRDAAADPADFGVGGVPHAWGIGEIRGNAMRDLASLYKLEMLPWDEWGRMVPSYKGETGPEFDALIDRVAITCADPAPDAVLATYRTEDLAVPAALIA